MIAGFLKGRKSTERNSERQEERLLHMTLVDFYRETVNINFVYAAVIFITQQCLNINKFPV